MRDGDIELKLEELAADEEGAKVLLATAHLMVPPEVQYFSQGSILKEEDLLKYDKLKSLNRKYHGLCEIISNYIISEDLLGVSDAAIQARLEQLLLANNTNKFDIKVKLSFLNAFSETHILDQATFSALSLAYFFDTYPFSLFTSKEMHQMNKEDNFERLLDRLNHLPDGAYVKFEAFSRRFFSLSGHSMVIKKMPQGFAFFDPNTGEERLDAQGLLYKIQSCKISYGTTCAFIDGDRYIQSIRPKIKSSTPEVTPSEHPMTKEIIASARELVSGNHVDDEHIIRFQDQVQTELSAYFINPTTHQFKGHSRHFIKKKLMERLTEFEQIKWQANAPRFKSMIEKFELAVKSGQPMSKLEAEEIRSSIQSFDDLMIFKYCTKQFNFSRGNVEILVDYKATKFIDSSYKYKIAHTWFPGISSSQLVGLINSAKSMNDVLGVVNAKRSYLMNTIFDSIRDQCPMFVRNLSDLIDVLEYLSDDQRRDICTKISGRLQDILSKEKNTAYDYCQALTLLQNENERLLLIQTILAQQPMHLETLSSLDVLSEHFDEAQFAFILSSVAEQIPELLTHESQVNELAFVIKQLNDKDWRKISSHVGEKLSFNTLMTLSIDTTITQERLSTLIQNSIELKSIIQNPASYDNLVGLFYWVNNYFPQESKCSILQQIKPHLLEHLDSMSSKDVLLAERIDLFIHYYPEDKQGIQRLTEYLVKNNFKHLKPTTARQVVDLLIQGFIDQDGKKIRAASELYEQHKGPHRSVLQWFKPKNEALTLGQCLPFTLRSKVTILLNQNQEKPDLT